MAMAIGETYLIKNEDAARWFYQMKSLRFIKFKRIKLEERYKVTSPSSISYSTYYLLQNLYSICIFYLFYILLLLLLYY